MAVKKKQASQKSVGDYHHGDLANAAVAVGLALIEEVGYEQLTLAEVGARLGVSAPALYRHFKNRDSLVSALAIAAFRLFTTYLKRSASHDAITRLRSMTIRYLSFEKKYPVRYELMFGRPRREHEEPELQSAGEAAFAVLLDALAAAVRYDSDEELRMRAEQVWATVHGFASLRCKAAFVLFGDAAVDDLAWDSVARILDLNVS